MPLPGEGEEGKEEVDDASAGEEDEALLLRDCAVEDVEDGIKVIQVSPVRETGWSEAWALIGVAVPLLLANLATFSTSMVLAIVVGRLGPNELAAATFSNTFQAITMYFATGTTMGLDGIAAQQSGAGQTRSLLLSLHHAALVAFATGIPLSLLWITVGWRLAGWLGQPDAVVQLAKRYMFISLAGLPALLAWSTLRRFLVAIKHPKPVTASAFASIASFGLLVYAMVWPMGLGFSGGVIALQLSRWIEVLVLAGGAWFQTPLRHWWSGWMWTEAVTRYGLLWTYVKLAVPSALMIMLEIWSFEALSIFAAHESTAALDSHSVGINVAIVQFMVPLAVAMSVSSRVGNALGAGDAPGARRTMRVGALVTLAAMSMVGGAIIAGRNVLPRIFLHRGDPALGLAARILVVVGLWGMADGTQVVALSVLRGVARPRAAMTINLVGYALVGWPLGLGLAYGVASGGGRLVAVYGGVAVGVLFTSLVGWAWLRWRVDMDREVELARDRVEAGAEEGMKLVEMGHGMIGEEDDDVEAVLLDDR